MKTKLALSLFIAVAFTMQTASADQCQLIEAEQIARALDYVKPNTAYVSFCEPCGDKDFYSRKPEVVKSLASTTTEANNETYWSLKLNDEEVDLAYIFIRKADGSFINLSKLADCPSSDVSVGFAALENTK